MAKQNFEYPSCPYWPILGYSKFKRQLSTKFTRVRLKCGYAD